MRRLLFLSRLLLAGVLTGCALSSQETPLPVSIAPTVLPTLTPSPTPAATLARGLVIDASLSVALSPMATWGYPLDIALLPIPVPTETQAPTSIPSGDLAAMQVRLMQTPLLYQMDTTETAAIFAYGQTLGNRPDVFTVVGDSNSTNGDFLVPFGSTPPTTCTFGDFDYLYDTVNYFQSPVDDSALNSFTFDSAAADIGFTSAAIFDPIWASPYLCASGETPLTCEFRRSRPAVVVIMLGGRDVEELSTDAYARNMTTLVESSITNGVIPILTTFVILPQRDVYARSLEMNMRLLDIAEAHKTPVINLWAAAQSLPDVGIGPDHTHLRAHVGSFCDFTGAQHEYGGTLRNLLTLQALDMLRRTVLPP